MPSFKLNPELGVDADLALSPASALVKYFRDPANLSLLITGLNPNRIGNARLEDPDIRSASLGLSFNRPISLGTGAPQLLLKAGVSGAIKVFVPEPGDNLLFNPDDYGENITVPLEKWYLSVSLSASIATGLTTKVSDLTFGFEPGIAATITNYREFDAGGPGFLEALKKTIQEFSIPGDLEDLQSQPAGSIITLNGKGSLTFSATANLLTAVNPLASVDLPVPFARLGIKGGESIKVGASYEISGEYQIRVQKLAASKVRLGYFKRRGVEFSVSASASAGISGGIGEGDLLTLIVGAISANPAVDKNELRNAGLDPAQIASIQAAVKAGVQRTLELSLRFELSALKENEAAFLYEIDLDALDDAGRAAVHQALDCDLSALIENEESLPPGIKVVRSIFSNLRRQKHTLRVNLLGIFNFTSISQLTLNGSVLYNFDTGELVISDSATVSRIQATAVNFGTENEKLRKVLAENFLITAAYRGSRSVIGSPELASSHKYFQLHNTTNQQTMKSDLDVAVALNLLTPADEQTLLNGFTDFGRTAFYAQTEYDDALSSALFLDKGEPRPIEYYENAGRRALLLLVGRDDPRSWPATDSALWKQMRAAGQPAFKQLFPKLNTVEVGAITADYTLIMWWAEAMSQTATKLAEVIKFFEDNPDVHPENNRFKTLRNELADHLSSVAKNTKEEFGRPWGLLAMDLASDQQAKASVQITGSHTAIRRDERAIGARI